MNSECRFLFVLKNPKTLTKKKKIVQQTNSLALFTTLNMFLSFIGARCSFVLSAFAHGAMGHRIDPSWGGPIELFLVPASARRLV